ncbi:addiction module antitoxin [Vampirovibrio sp.]|uniref:addiction module antitoxin n=1 Tax=Vampirovibrio sp. TaxID=2717857 RepID=UPI00359338B1
MKRKLTITVTEDVYEGLQAVVGPGNISQFLEDLARPHVVRSGLAEGYRMASEDEAQEKEALEWSNSLIGDVREPS